VPREIGYFFNSLLGEMRKHFHRDLRGKIIGELAKDFSRRPLEDIASDRRRLMRFWKRLPAQAVQS
jgi:hypothetical protein